jgi:hypothetical protein
MNRVYVKAITVSCSSTVSLLFVALFATVEHALTRLAG